MFIAVVRLCASINFILCHSSFV